MTSQKFIDKCKMLIVDYNNHIIDGVQTEQINLDKIFVVWQCKTLQNNKALLSTALKDGMYYEMTYNGDESKLYMDIYKKQENLDIDI